MIVTSKYKYIDRYEYTYTCRYVHINIIKCVYILICTY